DQEQSVVYLKREIIQADEINAFAYKRSLIEKAIRLNIKEKTLNDLSFELVKTLYKLNEYKVALENIYRLDTSKFSNDDKNHLQFIKASSLIGLRKLEEGKSILLKLQSAVNDNGLKQKIIVELA